MTILDKDYDFMEACLEIIRLRNHKENNPSPKLSPSATKATKQLVSESNLSSPAPSQTHRSNSRASSRQSNPRAASPTNSTISNLSTNSAIPWKEKLQILRQKIEDNRKLSLAQKEEARLNNHADKQQYEEQCEQQLRENNQRIKEKFAVAHQKNVEFGKELHQKQLDLDTAREAAELSIKKNKELALIEQNQREEELQKNLDLQTSLQNQREKECQEIRDLQVSLQVEREARKKEAAAYEEVLKVHQTNMT